MVNHVKIQQILTKYGIGSIQYSLKGNVVTYCLGLPIFGVMLAGICIVDLIDLSIKIEASISIFFGNRLGRLTAVFYILSVD